MTYRIFQYRLPMDGQPDDLNAWLASHRVVSVTQHLAHSSGSSILVFVVETTGETTPKPASGPKVDYKGNASYTHLPGQGLPIGALTSQYLGNFMLDRLDQGINRQEQRVPSLRVPRHGDAASPDDAPSRALPPAGRDETTGKTPPHPDTPCGAWRNGCGGAPTQPSPSHD